MITVEGETYTNCWICFDTRREKFYIRCTAEYVASAAQYVESGKKRAYFGDTDGFVMKFATDVDSVYEDNGQDINSFFTTNALDHGQPETIKHTSNITTFTENPQGMKIGVEADNSGVFKSSGQVLNKNVENYNVSQSANRFKYKFNETSQNQPWVFNGFVIETEIKEEKE